MYLYRSAVVKTTRPYGFDVDRDGILWEGNKPDYLYYHNTRTAEQRLIRVPDFGGRPVSDTKCMGEKVICLLFASPYYVVYDPATDTAQRMPVPGKNPSIWYGNRMPSGETFLYERIEEHLLIVHDPDEEPEVISGGDEEVGSSGFLGPDGILYMPLLNPCRLRRFDPAKKRFLGTIACPYPEVSLAGMLEHEGCMYFSDSAAGRLIPFEPATQTWKKPVQIPDHGKVFGFAGGCTTWQGKGYFSISTYRFTSQLDPKTGKLILPPGSDIGVDGRPHHFLDRFLVFDPTEMQFDYLVAEPQYDGYPLICYTWSDSERFVATGCVIPWKEEGIPDLQCGGDWIVLQSWPADAEHVITRHSLQWDRSMHETRYQRSYPADRSVFIPQDPWVPNVTNPQYWPQTYETAREEQVVHRIRNLNRERYWRDLAERVTSPEMPDEEKVTKILAFVYDSVYYNPTQTPKSFDPVVVLELHDGRCGQGVAISVELMKTIGIEARSVPVHHHVTCEAFYDGAWHIADAMMHGGLRPKIDGTVPSVAELQASPHAADNLPLRCFVYDEELLRTTDGFRLLGYEFGDWGTMPFYCWYMGAEKDCPPTLPVTLVAQRLGKQAVRLRWTESIKMGGGKVEYLLVISKDRRFRDADPTMMLTQPWFDFEVPEMNTMYYYVVKAVDDHRRYNADTWYPECRGNFAMVPEDQYGWYGML